MGSAAPHALRVASGHEDQSTEGRIAKSCDSREPSLREGVSWSMKRDAPLRSTHVASSGATNRVLNESRRPRHIKRRARSRERALSLAAFVSLDTGTARWNAARWSAARATGVAALTHQDQFPRLGRGVGRELVEVDTARERSTRFIPAVPVHHVVLWLGLLHFVNQGAH